MASAAVAVAAGALQSPVRDRRPVRRPQRLAVVAAGVSRPSARTTGQRMKIPKPARLSDPANIGTCAEGSLTLPDAGPGPGHLEKYMRLPIEQYVVLDGANITRIGQNAFKLDVPRMEFFDIWIAPILEVSVVLDETPGQTPKVVMQSQSCRLKGSPWIEDFKINDRMEVGFRAELKWQGVPQVGGGTGKLMCKTAVEVYCEQMPPFTAVPRSALEGTCNAVLNTFAPTILSLFLSKLAEDYVKWSTDPNYRLARQTRSKEIVDAVAAR